MFPVAKLSRRAPVAGVVFAALVIACGAILFANHAAAQTAAEAQEIAAKLPPQSQAVIERLSGLYELPDGAWKMHAGDLAHGEAANLDDSGWETIQPKGEAPNDAVWFRQTVQVPETLNGYDLTGSRIWFQFHAEANGPMPEILYFNGRRVALGDDLEPMILFDDAKPGEKVTIAVKLLHTVDKKNFRGATFRVEFPENRPNPEDLRLEFLSAALLVPSLAANDASQMDTLNGAIQTVDVAALDTHDQAKFDASLKASKDKARSAEASAGKSDVSPDGQLAHRCGVAVAVDRDGGRGEAHLRHRAATDV